MVLTKNTLLMWKISYGCSLQLFSSDTRMWIVKYFCSNRKIEFIISNNNNGIIRKINKKILLNIKLNRRSSQLKPIHVNVLLNIYYTYLLTNIMSKIRLQMFSYRFLTNTSQLFVYNFICLYYILLLNVTC